MDLALWRVTELQMARLRTAVSSRLRGGTRVLGPLRVFHVGLLGVLVGAGWPALWALAATGLPPGFQDANVVSGLSNPTAMQFAPDGRLFVCTQNGHLRVIDAGGTLLGTDFVTLSVDSTATSLLQSPFLLGLSALAFRVLPTKSSAPTIQTHLVEAR